MSCIQLLNQKDFLICNSTNQIMNHLWNTKQIINKIKYVHVTPHFGPMCTAQSNILQFKITKEWKGPMVTKLTATNIKRHGKNMESQMLNDNSFLNSDMIIVPVGSSGKIFGFFGSSKWLVKSALWRILFIRW